MGPFPHDAPPATISAHNPAGTDGFEFVEFAHPEPAEAGGAVRAHGLRGGGPAQDQGHLALPAGRHQLRAQRASRVASRRASSPTHGPCAPAMAWRVVDAQHALRARRRSSAPTAYTRRRQDARRAGHHRHRRLAALFRRSLRREGLALSDASSSGSASAIRARRASASTISTTSPTTSCAATWTRGSASTRRLFNFREIRFFDIEGKMTGPALAAR